MSVKRNLMIVGVIVAIIFIAVSWRVITKPVLPSDCDADNSYFTLDGELYETCLGKYLRELSEWSGTALTIVGGASCEDYPTSSGCGGYARCPSSAVGGCALDIYTDSWSFIQERELVPGEEKAMESLSLGITNCWEIYQCNELQCIVGDWTYRSCDSGCGDGYVLKERTTNPLGCAVDSGCEIRSECDAPPLPNCVDECYYVGNSYCGNDYVMSCRDTDADGCTENSQGEFCPYGCLSDNVNAYCETEPIVEVSDCVDECLPAGLMFCANDYITSCVVGSDGCTNQVQGEFCSGDCESPSSTSAYCVDAPAEPDLIYSGSVTVTNDFNLLAIVLPQTKLINGVSVGDSFTPDIGVCSTGDSLSNLRVDVEIYNNATVPSTLVYSDNIIVGKSLVPGACVFKTPVIPTGSWIPSSDYHLVVLPYEGAAKLPFINSGFDLINNPQKVSGGGVAWQFVVNPAPVDCLDECSVAGMTSCSGDSLIGCSNTDTDVCLESFESESCEFGCFSASSNIAYCNPEPELDVVCSDTIRECGGPCPACPEDIVKVCSPDNLDCNNSLLSICSYDGSSWVSYSLCTNGCASSGLSCIDEVVSEPFAGCDDNNDFTIDVWDNVQGVCLYSLKEGFVAPVDYTFVIFLGVIIVVIFVIWMVFK